MKDDDDDEQCILFGRFSGIALLPRSSDFIFNSRERHTYTSTMAPTAIINTTHEHPSHFPAGGAMASGPPLTSPHIFPSAARKAMA